MSFIISDQGIDNAGGDGSGGPVGESGFQPSMPMAPVPGLRDEGNVYRPIQQGGRPMTYMERVEERKKVEDVRHRLPFF